jgi:hypothetical protein
MLTLSCLVSLPCRGATAYLSEVGPPAIRFDNGSRHGSAFPTEFSFDESKPRPAKIEPPAALLASGNTNQTSGLAKVGTEPPLAAGTNYVLSAFPFQTPAAGSQSSGADISIVTPQMVLEFLKPGEKDPGDGNGKGAAIVVPVKIDFTPPIPINNSSTAIYKQE